MYTITLKNGTKIENLGFDGSNYVSDTELDSSVFTEDNLAKVTVNDGTNENEYTDLVFVQQILHEGKYLITFRVKSIAEKLNDNLTNVQVALAEIYESMLS